MTINMHEAAALGGWLLLLAVVIASIFLVGEVRRLRHRNRRLERLVDDLQHPADRDWP